MNISQAPYINHNQYKITIKYLNELQLKQCFGRTSEFALFLQFGSKLVGNLSFKFTSEPHFQLYGNSPFEVRKEHILYNSPPTKFC